ncbi:hypothetical protein QN224_25295 [Sinorhizobium sp. 8-89]|nr:hypothetical protein [Sinorhizobium sp. 7-81]MDK1388729.1 hypothetical protein [Sinorhizobium sp. 7-81]
MRTPAGDVQLAGGAGIAGDGDLRPDGTDEFRKADAGEGVRTRLFD